MYTTTEQDFPLTLNEHGQPATPRENELLGPYQAILDAQYLDWTTHFRLRRLLGTGGQGSVFLTDLRGADGFTVPIALKVFSPERFEDARSYSDAMSRIARVAGRIAQIQHDHLLFVQNFLDRHRIRIMQMEWVDGYDLSQLLVPKMLDRIRAQVSAKRWEYINEVIVTAGPVQPRIKPGIAVAVVRDCLSALAALHREGLVHSDIKPANIMLKRTGTAKIIDFGSAFEMEDPSPRRTCTPSYAAPEVLEGGEVTPLSDLASLGYVLIELLAGQPVFRDVRDYRGLLEAKRRLPHQLHELLPADVTCNELLMKFCRGLIAPDPVLRFGSADAANLNKDGAAGFHRQLVLGNLASEYTNEIRVWLEELKDLDEQRERQANNSTRLL